MTSSFPGCGHCINRMAGGCHYSVHDCRYKMTNALNPDVYTGCPHFLEKEYVLEYHELSIVSVPADAQVV